MRIGELRIDELKRSEVLQGREPRRNWKVIKRGLVTFRKEERRLILEVRRDALASAKEASVE